MAETQPIVSRSGKDPTSKDRKIKELEILVDAISQGKYMWESTFDAITNPVTIISSDYRILRANKAAARAGSVDVRHMIGTQCYETLAGIDQPCDNCPVRETLKTKQSRVASLKKFTKSGKEFEVNAYPLETEQATGQVVLHYRDVTEAKELQRQLVQKEKMASIGMLAGGVAHEINNPLGGVLAFTQLAMRELDENHPAQKDLSEIEDAALRCKRIVQDLLDFSRQSNDDMTELLMLNDVFEKIVPLIKVQAKATRAEVVYDLKDGLPAIRGNSQKLQQVFLNLITNAFHAMGQGGRVTVRTYKDERINEICAEISDTGPGIASEDIDRIFDPYYTTKMQGEGTGLGLSISYGIVRDHDGRIEVKSSRGKKGAKFVLTFPVAFNP